MTSLIDALQQAGNLKQQLNKYQNQFSPLSAPIQHHVVLQPLHSSTVIDDKLFSMSLQQTVQYKETQFIYKIEECIDVGKVLVAMLYSYRSVSRGIPQAQNQEQANRTEMYKTSYEVLKPEIKKMKDLSAYCDESINLITNCVKPMVPEYYVVKDSTTQMAQSGASNAAILKIVSEGRETKDFAPSSDFMLAFSRMLDLIMVVDMLKNSKASLNNDFSIYKRIWSNLKNLTGEVEDETMEQHMLHAFLGSQNVFSQRLKDKFIKECAGFEDFIVDIVNFCAGLFEGQQWVKPADKWMLLKCITYGLWLLDFGGDEGDISKRKKIKIDRFQKILKSNPVVPFFGDMSMVLASFFVKTPRLASLKFEHDPHDAVLGYTYKLVNQMDTIRSAYTDFITQFKINMSFISASLQRSPAFPDTDVHQVYNLCQKGLQLLSDWSARVLEQSAWKFSNPVSHQTNSEIPEDAQLYELAVRYNYNAEERLALVECIGMIKSMSHLLTYSDNFILECIYKHIYVSIQSFVKTTLKELIQHVQKKKKPIFQTMVQIYSILADRFEADYFDDSGKKSTASSNTGTPLSPSGYSAPAFIQGNIAPRILTTSLTQISYIRELLQAATGERAKGMQGGFMKEKDFKDSHVAEVNDFLNRSFYFPAMLNFVQNVNECSEMSELWYKEFYLEVTKQIQFPIEMSLPWILAETVLDSENPEFIEYLLYPLDIYNDAANRALHKLRTRFLYDEIEAEVNLCFDQLIWKLAQKVFTEAKTAAATHLLDKNFRKEAVTKLMVTEDRFDFLNLPYKTILKQKKFQLLGRHINISKLVAQHCTVHLRQSLDIAVSRFEASEITGIIELQRLIDQNRLTYLLLSKFMKLEPFEDLMAEVDEETSLVTLNGRIVAHTVQELLNDFLPNYSFNAYTSRFVKSPIPGSTENPRSGAPKCLPMYLCGTKSLFQAHNAICQLYSEFFGGEHMFALVQLLGAKHFGVLLGEMVRSVDLILKMNITPYVKALMKGLPHSTKLPPFEYGAQGSFDYFQLIMKPIISYKDLKSGVFQVFRELGNAVVFFQMTDQVFANNCVFTIAEFGDLLGEMSVIMDGRADPKLIVKNMFNENDKILSNDNLAISFAQAANNVHKSFQSYELVSMFSLFIEELKKMSTELKSQWEGQQNPEEIAIDHSEEFYRLWSGLQFAFAIPPPSESEFSNRELFGDAFQYAGCALIHCFQQEKRLEAFDFLNFLDFMQSNDPNGDFTGKKSGIIDLGLFSQNAKTILNFNAEIFRRLQAQNNFVQKGVDEAAQDLKNLTLSL